LLRLQGNIQLAEFSF